MPLWRSWKCRYCGCDALDAVPNRLQLTCLVCLRVESYVAAARRSLPVSVPLLDTRAMYVIHPNLLVAIAGLP